MEKDYLEQSAQNTIQARQILEESRLIPLWQAAGATVHLIGSLAIGTLGKHLDIDLHIYTDELDVAASFAVMAQVTRNLHIRHVCFTNLAYTDECCFEWHLQYETDNGRIWQIDVIQIKRGSLYDGYFEKQNSAIKEAMSEEMRRTILKLKFETPDDMKIPGIEYYKAVIQDGVRDFSSLIKWREHNHSENGIIIW